MSRQRRVHLVHWKAAEARERAARITALGYETVFVSASPTMLRDLRKRPPDAVVIDLTRLPAQGRDIAVALRQTQATRHVPLVFVDGDPAKVAKIRHLLPDAVYTPWRRIRNALAEAIAHPPTEPVTFRSGLAAYAGVALVKKLGIKQGGVVTLVNAPPTFAQLLDPLPPGVRLRRQLRGKSDLTIWFTRSRRALEKRISTMVRHAENGRLWIVWPKKTSSLASDLTPATVRQLAMAAGLVDYKVGAIDTTWTGLQFTRHNTAS